MTGNFESKTNSSSAWTFGAAASSDLSLTQRAAAWDKSTRDLTVAERQYTQGVYSVTNKRLEVVHPRGGFDFEHPVIYSPAKQKVFIGPEGTYHHELYDEVPGLREEAQPWSGAVPHSHAVLHPVHRMLEWYNEEPDVGPAVAAELSGALDKTIRSGQYGTMSKLQGTPNINWEPGNWGKWGMDEQGNVHAWNVDHAGGSPHHMEVFQDMHGTLPEGSDEEWYLERYPVPVMGEVDHTGTLTGIHAWRPSEQLPGGSYEAAMRHVVEQHPAWKFTPEHQWQFYGATKKDEMHIGLDIPKQAATEIYNWVHEHEWPEGTELEPLEDYHVTLLFSQAEGSSGHREDPWIRHDKHAVTISGIKEFPPSEEKDGLHPIVLEIESDTIHAHHTALAEGAEDSGMEISQYSKDKYQPHMTIAYGPKLPEGIHPPKITFETEESTVSEPRDDEETKSSEEYKERHKDDAHFAWSLKKPQPGPQYDLTDPAQLQEAWEKELGAPYDYKWPKYQKAEPPRYQWHERVGDSPTAWLPSRTYEHREGDFNGSYAGQMRTMYEHGHLHEPELERTLSRIQQKADARAQRFNEPSWQMPGFSPSEWQDMLVGRQNYLRNTYESDPRLRVDQYEERMQQAADAAARHGVDPLVQGYTSEQMPMESQLPTAPEEKPPVWSSVTSAEAPWVTEYAPPLSDEEIAALDPTDVLGALKARRPIIYHNGRNEAYIGAPGWSHQQLEREMPYAHENEEYTYGGELRHPRDTSVYWTHGSAPPEVLDALSQYTGVPADHKNGYGFRFAAAAPYMAALVKQADSWKPQDQWPDALSGEADPERRTDDNQCLCDTPGAVCTIHGANSPVGKDREGPEPWIRQAHVLNWQPGQSGKFVINKDGTLHTFGTDTLHNRYITDNNLDWAALGGLDPEGGAIVYERNGGPTWEFPPKSHFQAQVEAITHPEAPSAPADWHFGAQSDAPWWHITDNPNFDFDPEHTLNWNSTMGNMGNEPPGMFLTQNPEYWFNGHDYVRPYAAEIEAPEHALEPGYMESNDRVLPAHAYPQSRIKRVIPIDEYARETYGEPGWIEANQDYEGVGYHDLPKYRDYRYEGPDVRDMSTEEHQHHADRVRRYIEAVRPHILDTYDENGERVPFKRQAADEWDSREYSDSIQYPPHIESPRATDPHASPKVCTCKEGEKLHCPIHGLDPVEFDPGLAWHIPENSPVGYPEDQPRNYMKHNTASYPQLVHHSVIDWEEGYPGKWALDTEGTFRAWPVDGAGWPHHTQIVDPREHKISHFGEVTPNGELYLSSGWGDDGDDALMDEAAKLHPSFSNPEGQDWSFESKVAAQPIKVHELEPGGEASTHDVTEEQWKNNEGAGDQSKPFIYVPKHQTIYLGNPGWYHDDIHDAVFGLVKPANRPDPLSIPGRVYPDGSVHVYNVTGNTPEIEQGVYNAMGNQGWDPHTWRFADAPQKPPNLRKGSEKEHCGNCKMYWRNKDGKGHCNGYGEYDVGANETCDSWFKGEKREPFVAKTATPCPECGKPNCTEHEWHMQSPGASDAETGAWQGLPRAEGSIT